MYLFFAFPARMQGLQGQGLCHFVPCGVPVSGTDCGAKYMLDVYLLTVWGVNE